MQYFLPRGVMIINRIKSLLKDTRFSNNFRFIFLLILVDLALRLRDYSRTNSKLQIYTGSFVSVSICGLCVWPSKKFTSV